MTEFSPPLLAAIALTFFLAGTVKGVTGMGLPTVSMGVLGALLSPLSAAALLLVPSFVTNVWQLGAGPALRPLLRRLGGMLLGIVLGSLAGASVLAGGNARGTAAALGVVLMIYAAYTLFARQLQVAPAVEAWLSPLCGLVTGAISGATGIFVIPAVPYLQALGLEKDELVQALGLSFTVSTVALALALLWHGVFQWGNLGLSVLAVAPALLGMWAGQRLRGKISPVTFRRGFLICLFLLGAELALRALR